VAGPTPFWVTMPGHIDSPQPFATVSRIGVRSLGALAGSLTVVFVVMMAVELLDLRVTL